MTELSSTPSLTQRLGSLIAQTAPGDIPDAIMQRAKVSLLHNLSVGLVGRRREAVAHLMAQRLWGSPAEATLLHDGARVSLEAAAFANSALMNARSQDDTHPGSTSHPGSPSMAAALAVCEAGGGSGLAFLTASVLGYEVLCRVGRDFDERVTARGFRAASLLGGFGAAAAAASLLRLNAAQSTAALGLAANLAGGLSQVWREGSPEGPLQLGFAARNGVSAARAAACGAGAAVHALEGPAGFFRAFADSGELPHEALEGIGRLWQLDEVTVKPFPVCAILQGPVGLLFKLCKAHGITRAAPLDIELSLSPYEAGYPGIDHAGPFSSSIATKMSAQFSLALALVDGRITPEGLDRVSDAQVLDLAARARVVADPEVVPRQCRLAIRLTDGRMVSGAVETPVGRPDFATASRFAQALVPEIGTNEAAMDRLIEAVAGLQQARDVSELIAAAVACRA